MLECVRFDIEENNRFIMLIDHLQIIDVKSNMRTWSLNLLMPVLASGSLKATTSNGIITLFSDVSIINVVVSSEHVVKGVVDPASDATCVITMTGVCLRLERGDTGFLFETGAWSTEVCSFTRPSDDRTNVFTFTLIFSNLRFRSGVACGASPTPVAG